MGYSQMRRPRFFALTINIPLAADGEPRRLPVHKKEGDPPVPFGRVGFGHQQDEVRPHAVGDENFTPV